jgi:hypothetical protein
MQGKEDIDILDIIKEYLKHQGLKTTLDCFEKESSDKKKVKVQN